MVGNVALDVVIGLVFVYLLYSLYATVVMEIISSFFGLRARNLCYAVSRMLMDEEPIEGTFRRIFSRMATTVIRVAGKSANMKNPELYDQFFGQPSIKYLSSGGVGNRPSYLSAENFSRALIDVLKTDDPDFSLLARIEGGLAEMPADSETKEQIQSLLDEANNDLVKFKILLERWYNDTMDRATGWFKQTTQMILVFIGFILVVSFNVDTLAIIQKLSKDEDARAQMVALATNFTQQNAALIPALKIADTTQTLEARLDSLQAIRHLLQEDIKNSQNVLSSDWHLPASISYTEDSRDSIHRDSVQIRYLTENSGPVYLIVHKSLDTQLLKRVLSKKTVNKSIEVGTKRYKLGYVFDFDNIWGYLLTVLALSLGAPFWFDLLNKLIKLRSAKAISSTSDRPIVATPDSPVADRNLLNRVG